MRWPIIVAAALALACGRGAPAAESAPVATVEAEPSPEEETSPPSEPEPRPDRPQTASPGPRDCWAEGDIREIPWKEPDRPLRGIPNDDPACDEALSDAVSDGDLSAARIRLGRGTPTLKCQVESGWTLLHLAAMSGNHAMAALLIRKGADVSACDITGTTPLHYAVRDHHRSVVELLLREGAYVDAVSIGGSRPLHEALAFSPPGTGEDDADDEWAAEKRREYANALRIVELLLRYGATVDVPDSSGKTALHIAASHDNRDAVEALLSAGASVSVKDAGGRTPAEVADDPQLAERLRAR